MEQQQYLIDTNVVIDYLGLHLPTIGMEFMNDVVDNVINISVITKIEVLSFNTAPSHYNILSNFIDDSNVLDLTQSIVDECIKMRKKYKIKLPDAIIGATALVYDLVLITRNISDFRNIKGLKTFDPHKL